MAATPATASETKSASKFKQRLTHEHLVRIHMSLILAGVVASGVLSSKLLLMLGVRWFAIRYPLAVLVSYGVFLGLVRIWIWYVAARRTAALAMNLGGNGDFSIGGSGGSGGGGGGGFSGFGGGSSGGGGASSSWEDGAMAANVIEPGPTGGAASSSGGSSWFNFNFDFDLDGDGWLVIVLLVALVLVVVFAGGYLVYIAPQLLPEAAWQAVLASTLTRVSKEDHHDWMRGVLGRTAIPFTLVLLFATATGWAAHRYCPTALRLVDLLHCR